MGQFKTNKSLLVPSNTISNISPTSPAFKKIKLVFAVEFGKVASLFNFRGLRFHYYYRRPVHSNLCPLCKLKTGPKPPAIFVFGLLVFTTQSKLLSSRRKLELLSVVTKECDVTMLLKSSIEPDCQFALYQQSYVARERKGQFG